MANTTYDEIWTQFLDITKTDDINLPNTNQKIYDAIKSAVRHYNNRFQDTITCDDTIEQVSEILIDNKLILIAHYLKLIFLKNQLNDFVSTWQPFQKDIGVKFLRDQISGLQYLIDKEEKEIEEIILNSEEDYI